MGRCMRTACTVLLKRERDGVRERGRREVGLCR